MDVASVGLSGFGIVVTIIVGFCVRSIKKQVGDGKVPSEGNVARRLIKRLNSNRRRRRTADDGGGSGSGDTAMRATGR